MYIIEHNREKRMNYLINVGISVMTTAKFAGFVAAILEVL